MVTAAETRELARADLVDRWDAQRLADRDQTRIILTHTNAEVRDLNLAARGRLRASGELGEDVRVSAERGAREFASGDRIMFLKNERGLGVKNGTLGEIERVSAERMAVRLDDGRSVAFDTKDYAHVDHGYAATIHKSQGVTVDRAHVLATPGMDRHSAYVALSRHRDGVQLHYGRDDFAEQRQLVRTLGRERVKDMASDYPMFRDRDGEVRAFAERRGLSGEIRLPDAPDKRGVEILGPRAGTMRTMGQESGVAGRNADRGVGEAKAAPGPEPRRGLFDGLRSGLARSAPERGQGVQGDKPRRSIFDGLKLSAAPVSPAPAKVSEPGADRSYVQAVERVARSAQAIVQAQDRGAPVLEHQKVALSEARDKLEQVRPGAVHDMMSAAARNPALIGEAAAGRSASMLAAIGEEGRVRADPGLRADRFVADWQKLTQARERLDGAGDRSGSEKARQAMLGMAKGLERDPQVESLLRGRTRELGLDARMDKLPNIERRLGRELEMDLGLGRGRDLGMSR